LIFLAIVAEWFDSDEDFVVPDDNVAEDDNIEYVRRISFSVVYALDLL
jgi:hypothetical protein